MNPNNAAEVNNNPGPAEAISPRSPEFSTLVEILASESANVPSEIEILRPGSWNNTPNHPDFEVSADDLDEYAANFKAGIRKGVPIDVEHRQDKKYGSEAVGWLKDVYTSTKDDGSKVLMGSVDWNNTGKEVLADKKFKFVSAEFNPRQLPYRDPEGKLGILHNVLKAVTLTNHPLMKGLAPVVASENGDDSSTSGLTHRFVGHIIYAEEKGDTSVPKLDEVRTKDASALTDEDKALLVEHKADLSDAELTKFGLKEAPVAASDTKDESKDEPKKEEVQATDGSVTISASELTELKRMAAAGAAADAKLQRKEAEEIAKSHVTRGAIKADQQGDTVELLIKASETNTRDQVEKFLNELPENKVITAGEVGEGPKGKIGSAAEALETKANEILANDKDGKLTYADAIKMAAKAEPELANAYDKE